MLKKSYFVFQLTVIICTVFLSSCNFNNIGISLLNKSSHAIFYLEAEETEDIRVGESSTNNSLLVVYSCSFSFNNQSSQSCDSLSNLHFDSQKGSFDWRPSYQEHGIYKFTLASNKGATKVFVIEVNKKNVAPALVVNAPGLFEENNNYQVSLDAVDVNGDAISYNYECLSGNCNNLKNISLNSTTGIFSFDTDFSSSGSYQLRFRASDGELSSEEILSFNVVNINRAPFIASTTNVTMNEGQIWFRTLDASDPDGDSIIYNCLSCPSGMSINNLGVISWAPSSTQSGNYTIQVEVSDGELSSSMSFNMVVNNVNEAPVLASIADQNVEELTAITPIDANDSGDDFDVDGDAITYSCFYDTAVDGSVDWVNACTSLSGLSFNSSTGVLTWTPGLGSAGIYEFRIVGSDGFASGSRLFTITVKTLPLTMTFRTTTASESIALPTRSGFAYNYKVDWGDGSAIESFATSASQTHTYATAGDYTVRIYGQFSAIYFNGLSSTLREKLISVSSLGRVGLISLEGAFQYCSNLVSFDNGNGETSNVTTTASMFLGASKLESIDLSSFNSENVVSIAGMFYGLTALTELDLSNFDTSQVTSMNALFYGANRLTELDLSSFDTTNVTSMNYMFYGMSSLTSIDISSFNTSNVTNMAGMFSAAYSLTDLDLSHFNTAQVTTMSYMFDRTYNLRNLNLSGFNTANVTDMSAMFDSTSSLTSLNLSSFNTANVTNMSSMFNGASSLTSLNLSNFNTANVTRMSSMFSNTTGLSSLNLSNFNTANVTDMSAMFSNSRVTNLDLSNFNTAKVVYMNFMFVNNNVLASLNLSNFNTANVVNMYGMFQGTQSLTSLDLSSFRTEKVTDMTQLFWSSGITSLNLSGWILNDPLPTTTNIFLSTPVSKVVYCSQDPIGNAFGITCTP